jgi:hypothetical protein
MPRKVVDVVAGLTTIVLIFFVPLIPFGLIVVRLHRRIGRKFVIHAPERDNPKDYGNLTN